MHLHCLGIQSTIQVNSAWPSHWDRQNAYWWKLGSKQASPVTTHCSSLCVVLRCKLVSGWGLRKWKVAPSSGHVAVEGIFYVQKRWQNISIHKSSQRRCLTAGPQMVAVNLQRHMRALRGHRQHHDRRRLWRLFTLYYGTIVAVSVMDGQSNDTLVIYHTNRLSCYRYLQDDSMWHAQPMTLDMTRCEVTAMEHNTSCDSSTVEYVLTHVNEYSCMPMWRHRDVEVRKTFAFCE